MPILLKEDYEYPLPEMYRIEQHFFAETVDVEHTLEEELKKPEITNKIKPGMRVAIAVGSRGIDHLFFVVEKVVRRLKELGAEPFIVSAMGSHGGGTMEGQKEVLSGYGITPERLHVPVITSVDVVTIGNLKNGQPVFFDRAAAAADLIIPINRIKLHTDFVGALQSGLCKMLVIGLGNHRGCMRMHEEEPAVFAARLEEAAALILEKAKVGFGVALMENAYDQTCHVEAVASEKLIAREKELVRRCKKLMPYINIKQADIIVVEEIGKDISGAGYDPNILGRSCVLKQFVLPIPAFQKMVLLDVTEASHGNAIGLGQFEVITKKVFEKMDYEKTYANALACKCVEDARIPLMAEDEEQAVRIALKACRNLYYDKLKIIRIKNTLKLQYIEVSEALLEEVEKNSDLRVVS